MLHFSHTLRGVLVIGAVAATAATALTGCSSGDGNTVADNNPISDSCTPAYEGFETVSAGVLTVATYDFPPLTIVDGSEVSGVEGELLSEVAQRLCLTLKVESAGGANAAIPSVESGRADIAAGDWYRTAARAEIVHLSAPLYLDLSSVVSTQGLAVEDLEGKRVASVVGNLWNDSLQKWLGDDFVVYQDDESIYGDLKAGRIDAIISGTAGAAGRLKDNPLEGGTIVTVTPTQNVPEFDKPGQVGWPTSYDNETFGAVLDKIIADLHADGVIGKTLTKWELDPSAADVGEPYEL